jgi:hypothetical protein
VDTTRLKRKAGKQTRVIRDRAGDLGGTVRRRAGQVGGAVRARAGDLGERAAVRTRGARRSVGYWIAGEEPRKRSRWWVVGAGAAGAAAAFFLDPVSGKRRRHVARDWIAARFRGAGTRVTRSATHARQAGPPENDATLSHKVESEAFRNLDIAPGRINVNAEFGVVTLRGAVDRPDQIEELERRTRAVEGVRDVHNLVHLAGTAPTT